MKRVYRGSTSPAPGWVISGERTQQASGIPNLGGGGWSRRWGPGRRRMSGYEVVEAVKLEKAHQRTAGEHYASAGARRAASGPNRGNRRPSDARPSRRCHATSVTCNASELALEAAACCLDFQRPLERVDRGLSTPEPTGCGLPHQAFALICVGSKPTVT